MSLHTEPHKLFMHILLRKKLLMRYKKTKADSCLAMRTELPKRNESLYTNTVHTDL